eukprot:9135-Heterococcus_DN1.PRE.1
MLSLQIGTWSLHTVPFSQTLAVSVNDREQHKAQCREPHVACEYHLCLIHLCLKVHACDMPRQQLYNEQDAFNEGLFDPSCCVYTLRLQLVPTPNTAAGIGWEKTVISDLQFSDQGSPSRAAADIVLTNKLMFFANCTILADADAVCQPQIVLTYTFALDHSGARTTLAYVVFAALIRANRTDGAIVTFELCWHTKREPIMMRGECVFNCATRTHTLVVCATLAET